MVQLTQQRIEQLREAGAFRPGGRKVLEQQGFNPDEREQLFSQYGPQLKVYGRRSAGIGEDRPSASQQPARQISLDPNRRQTPVNPALRAQSQAPTPAVQGPVQRGVSEENFRRSGATVKIQSDTPKPVQGPVQQGTSAAAFRATGQRQQVQSTNQSDREQITQRVEQNAKIDAQRSRSMQIDMDSQEYKSSTGVVSEYKQPTGILRGTAYRLTRYAEQTETNRIRAGKPRSFISESKQFGAYSVAAELNVISGGASALKKFYSLKPEAPKLSSLKSAKFQLNQNLINFGEQVTSTPSKAVPDLIINVLTAVEGPGAIGKVSSRAISKAEYTVGLPKYETKFVGRQVASTADSSQAILISKTLRTGIFGKREFISGISSETRQIGEIGPTGIKQFQGASLAATRESKTIKYSNEVERVLPPRQFSSVELRDIPRIISNKVQGNYYKAKNILTSAPSQFRSGASNAVKDLRGVATDTLQGARTARNAAEGLYYRGLNIATSIPSETGILFRRVKRTLIEGAGEAGSIPSRVRGSIIGDYYRARNVVTSLPSETANSFRRGMKIFGEKSQPYLNVLEGRYYQARNVVTSAPSQVRQGAVRAAKDIRSVGSDIVIGASNLRSQAARATSTLYYRGLNIATSLPSETGLLARRGVQGIKSGASQVASLPPRIRSSLSGRYYRASNVLTSIPSEASMAFNKGIKSAKEGIKPYTNALEGRYYQARNVVTSAPSELVQLASKTGKASREVVKDVAQGARNAKGELVGRYYLTRNVITSLPSETAMAARKGIGTLRRGAQEASTIPSKIRGSIIGDYYRARNVVTNIPYLAGRQVKKLGRVTLDFETPESKLRRASIYQADKARESFQQVKAGTAIKDKKSLITGNIVQGIEKEIYTSPVQKDFIFRGSSKNYGNEKTFSAFGGAGRETEDSILINSIDVNVKKGVAQKGEIGLSKGVIAKDKAPNNDISEITKIDSFDSSSKQITRTQKGDRSLSILESKQGASIQKDIEKQVKIARENTITKAVTAPVIAGVIAPVYYPATSTYAGKGTYERTMEVSSLPQASMPVNDISQPSFFKNSNSIPSDSISLSYSPNIIPQYKTVVAPISNLREPSKPASRNKSGSVSKEDSISDVISNIKIAQRQDSKAGQASKLSFRQLQLQRNLNKPTSVFPRSNFRTTTPEIFIPVTLPNLKPKAGQSTQTVESYRPFIRKGKEGKKVYLGGVFDLARALQIAQGRATTTVAATFGADPTGATIKAKPSSFKADTNVFRSYRIRQGQRVPLMNEFIQRQGKRLISSSEVSDLTRYRRKR